jgi:WD40 repeat protein
VRERLSKKVCSATLAALLASLSCTRVCAAEPAVLEGHSGSIAALAFSPDGKWLASGATGNDDHGVRLWNAADGTSVFEYQPDERGAAFALAFAPDGKRLVVADLGLSLRVLEIPSGRELAAWPTSPDKGYAATRVAFSPDGRMVAAGLRDGTIKLYDATSGKLTGALAHGSEITALAFSPDSHRLASGTGYGARVWDPASGTAVVKLDRDSSGQFEVLTLAFTPDGKTLVAGDGSGSVRFLSATDGAELRSFPMPRVGDSTTIDALVVASDGKTIYCTGMLPDPGKETTLFEGVVALDAASGKPLGAGQVNDTWGEHVERLALTPDGKRLAVSVNGSTEIYLLNTASIVPVNRLGK